MRKWVINEDGDSVEVEEVEGEGDGGNADITGISSIDTTPHAFDLDIIVFYANADDAHLSTKEELDNDEDYDDLGDDVTRALETKSWRCFFTFSYLIVWL